jgi:hypothetical protein
MYKSPIFFQIWNTVLPFSVMDFYHQNIVIAKYLIIFQQKRKMVGDATSTQVLRDLEISLRTNHIE